MNTQEIVQKLWNLCDVLRDDGITYHQYVTELTYILFLKMAKETEAEKNIPEGYRWDDLLDKKGVDLKRFYKKLLSYLGEESEGRIKEIYANAGTNIDEPRNLEKIIRSIDGLDWYSAKHEGLGDLYEGLLEKNANEKKSGAGQYFTPRPLINVMVRLIKPQPGERCGDPACGTFGFMIAADSYIKGKTDELFDLKEAQQKFQRREAFSGMELVQDAYRLTLMNAMLHDIEGKIMLGDTLSNAGKAFRDYNVILTNPPFGTKKGGERPTRDDLTFPSSNKQLNFLQVIYRSLRPNGKSRAAVVLPDNVLFQDGDGQKVRADLMEKCNLHTILRLPTGIFYAQGVKTNVLFFTRGTTEKGNTKEVFFYDLRTNIQSLGKTHPLTESHFKEFEDTFNATKKEKLKLERWNEFSRKEIKGKGDSLDLGLIKDDSIISQEDLPNPVESADEAIAKLEQASDLLAMVIKELQMCGVE
ncbi:MAG: N-6 DNA methylase [Thermodesulfobacteriota bacterium]|nr:N-6 DNA methylase [Thermodesulfobacteriota bacterium]